MKRLAITLILLSAAAVASAQNLFPVQEVSLSESTASAPSPATQAANSDSPSPASSEGARTVEPASSDALLVELPLNALPLVDAATTEASAPVFTYREQKRAPKPAETHRFFDKRNTWMTVASVGAQTLDAVTTRYNLDHYSNVKERSPVARLFENEGWAGTVAFHYGINAGGSLLLQYLAHRSGHHRMERWIPTLTIGQSIQGSIMNIRTRAVGIPRK